MKAFELKQKAIEILDSIDNCIPQKVQPLLKARLAKIGRQLEKLQEEANELITAITFNQEDSDY